MKKSVGAILIGESGRWILQHRDNKPDISNPDKIGFFGGKVETGEDPADAIRRELKEELELTLDDLALLETFIDTDQKSGTPVKTKYLYWAKNITENNLHLHEGQRIIYLSPDDNLNDLPLTNFTRYLINKFKGKL